MRGLIIVLTLMVLLAFSTYLLFQKGPYLLWFSFCLLPIFVAAYISGLRVALFLFLFTASFAFLALLFNPRDWPWLLVLVVAFYLVLPLARQISEIEKRHRKLWRDRLNESKRSYEKLKDEDKKINAMYIRLDQDLTKISSLYQVTKDMGGSLGFTDIFAVLSGTLRTTFDFSRSKLILIDEEKKTIGIERIYQIQVGRSLVNEVSREEKGRKTILAKELRQEPVEVNIQNFDRRIIKVLFEERRPIVITPLESLPRGVGLVLPSTIESLIAAPLIVEDKIMGAITMENFKGEVYDKFLILADQLALEIKKVRLYETIQELAVIDGLTKVYVRRHFLERYDEELKRSRRHRLKLSFFMVDIDHFKHYNDEYGHLVGDVALQEVAEIIKNSVRRVDLVCRYGGEEFAVLLPQTDKEGALRVAERIRWAAENHSFRAYNQLTKVTVSIGIATFPADAKLTDELVERADEALYKAKEMGRNRVVAYGDSPQERRL